MLSFGLDALYCALRSISLTVKRGSGGFRASGISYLSDSLCPLSLLSWGEVSDITIGEAPEVRTHQGPIFPVSHRNASS